MPRNNREWKPRDQYLRDKIAYTEQKLMYEYGQLAKIDPDFRPNFVPNDGPIQATVINTNPAIEDQRRKIRK